MYPAYWRSLFTSAGWDIDYLGEVTPLADGPRWRSPSLPDAARMIAARWRGDTADNVRYFRNNIRDGIRTFEDDAIGAANGRTCAKLWEFHICDFTTYGTATSPERLKRVYLCRSYRRR
jgi:hypothetical protein